MGGSEKKSILIVDDDITIRKLLSHHLKINNYITFEAPDAAEGFKQLEKEKINLVLCDVTMEKMDGFTFCREVRKNENFRALPFIFVTAKSSHEDKSLAVESGGDDFISKPFDVQDLLLKVQALIRRSDIYKIYGAKKSLRQSSSKNTSHILMVEDDSAFANLIHINLTKAGFECTLAKNVDEGMQRLRTVIPDIIISDIMMPEKDGFEFRRMISEDAELKNIPFIFLTSKGEENDILDGYNVGVNEYVVKTAGPKVLVAKVKAILKSLGKERQKVVNEIHSAAELMRAKVVPDSPPRFAGFDIQQWHLTYQGIPGGDFIDYFQMNDDCLAVVLGDVMGKKWGAWYFAFAYAAYVRSALRGVLMKSDDLSPSAILQQVNNSVYKDTKVSEIFATISILLLNRKNKTIKYSGAGDLPLIYRSTADNSVQMLQARGMLLGFASNGDYEDITAEVNPGDMFFLITDGILHSRNRDGEQYGRERLFEVIRSLDSKASPVKAVEKNLSQFSESKFDDDLSIISVRAE